METQSIARTIASLTEHGFEPIEVRAKEAALEKIRELIPRGASVMNGASTTLQQIGYIDFLKNNDNGWQNLHERILAETDPEKQGKIRRESVVSDFYLGSAHAITEEGEIVIASNTGSQLPHLAYTSPNIILVVGMNKIVPTLSDALSRIAAHVIPLEDERMKGVYGYGTTHAKTLILHKENQALGRTVRIIVVHEELGF